MKRLIVLLSLLVASISYSATDPVTTQSPQGWTSMTTPNHLYYQDGGLIRFDMPGQYGGVDTVLVEHAGPFTVTFGDVWAKVLDYEASNTGNPGWGNFANEPSSGAVITPYYFGGAGDANIYITGDDAHYVSLWFSNYITPFTFSLWGQGVHSDSLLATVSSDTLGTSGSDDNYDCYCCPSGSDAGFYCKWKKLVLTSTTKIKYFNVSGFAVFFVIDEILIGKTTSTPTLCNPTGQPCDFE